MNKAQIASNASMLVGAGQIQSLDDQPNQAELLKSIYDTTKVSLLMEEYWVFAKRQAVLQELAKTPNQPYQVVYSTPADYLSYARNSEGIQFEIFGTELHSYKHNDNEPFTINYIANLSEALLPQFFINVLQYRLARDICMGLTDDNSKFQLLSRQKEVELDKALSINLRDRDTIVNQNAGGNLSARQNLYVTNR